jgi:hypothetical protein
MSLVTGAMGNAIARCHIVSEHAVGGPGVAFTFIQPDAFRSNTLRWIPQLRAGDVIRTSPVRAMGHRPRRLLPRRRSRPPIHPMGGAMMTETTPATKPTPMLDWGDQSTWTPVLHGEDYLHDPIRAGEVVLSAVGTQLDPFVDADDIADVAVAALTEPRHGGQVYDRSIR